MLVRAKVDHIEPETLFYRNEGEKFERRGKLYKHVEPVKEAAPKTTTEEAE